MTVDQDEARDKLKRIQAELKLRLEQDGAHFLDGQWHVPNPPSFDLDAGDARWLADGIEAFLSGTAKTLEHALGLVRPPGRPAGHNNARIAEQWAQSEKLTNEKLAGRVSQKYPTAFKNSTPDEKTVRRAIGSTKDPATWTPDARQAIADEVVRRLAKHDPPATKDPDGHK